MAYCTECGQALGERDKFCAQCGTRVRRPAAISAPPSVTPDHLVHPDSPAAASSTDVAPPQYGSMFGSVAEPLSDDANKNKWPAWLIASIAVASIVLGAAAGYWWFGRPGVTGAASTVDTERAIASQSGGEAGDAHTSASGWRVVETFTGAVQHPAAAEGVPDGQTAIIPPADSLALEWRPGEFYNGEGSDVRIVGPEATRSRYTIFSRTTPSDKWVRFDINTRGFPGGEAAHDFGHHGIESAREVLIRNEGTTSLEVDAVIPLHTAPQAHAEEDRAHENGR